MVPIGQEVIQNDDSDSSSFNVCTIELLGTINVGNYKYIEHFLLSEQNITLLQLASSVY